MKPSVKELVKYILDASAEVTAAAPGGASAEAAAQSMMDRGCVSVQNAGNSGLEQSRGAPLQRKRLAVHCYAPTEEQADRIQRAVEHAFNLVARKTVYVSTGDGYVVHTIMVNGGPNGRRENATTWDEFMFAEALVGNQPLT